MSKILVYGKNGQVGWELQRSLALVGDVVFLGREDRGGDLLDIDSMVARIREEKPEIIFNAAAYTAVDAAENDLETARGINCDAVAAMADVCKELNALLIHYSTDYVFNGTGEHPWKEDDHIDPINVYGSTKALGEKAIIESGCKAYIFRTSWIFGIHGNNFLKTILHIATNRNKLKVVSDQIGVPTAADFVADVSTYLAVNRVPESGEIVNLVPHGEVSWFDYANLIITQSKIQNVKIEPVSTLDYTTVAKRPLNSRLDNSKIKSLLPPGGIKDWRFYVLRTLEGFIRK